MKIIDSPLEIQTNELFFLLKGFAKKLDVYLKLEGLNIAGSIKLKPAIHMINYLERKGFASPGQTKIIESSSGNLGVALSLVSKVRGYEFTCVTDPNLSPVCRRYIEVYGGKILPVKEKDENGGYLNTRINLIKNILASNEEYVWTNQYANPANIEAHYIYTGAVIHKCFPELGMLFVGAGTTGTLVGCAKYFQEHSPNTSVVAVDSVGSVTFGGPPSARYLPGLGTSRKPEIMSMNNVHDVVMIPERDTAKMAADIFERFGLFIGASTATVLCGVQQYIERGGCSLPIVAIGPDFGDRYLDTLYDKEWVNTKYATQNVHSTVS